MCQTYIECGCCGQYHRNDYYGDCRNDTERLNLEDIPEYAEIIGLGQQEEDAARIGGTE
jgi:hypothetical protein